MENEGSTWLSEASSEERTVTEGFNQSFTLINPMKCKLRD
jgi:hypothetical protein